MQDNQGVPASPTGLPPASRAEPVVSGKAGIPNADALRDRMVAAAGGTELVELLPSISARSERRPQRSEDERAQIAEKFAAHLPKPGAIQLIGERDINAMRAAFIRRFNEDLPRTETLLAVAAIGYRMALRDFAQGIEAGTTTTEGRGPKDEGPVAESDAPRT